MSNELFNQSNDNIIDNITNNDINTIRTNDSTVDTFSITERGENVCDKVSENNNNVNINIYRYKFTDDFTNELFKF